MVPRGRPGLTLPWQGEGFADTGCPGVLVLYLFKNWRLAWPEAKAYLCERWVSFEHILRVDKVSRMFSKHFNIPSHSTHHVVCRGQGL